MTGLVVRPALTTCRLRQETRSQGVRLDRKRADEIRRFALRGYRAAEQNSGLGACRSIAPLPATETAGITRLSDS
jgi:hypothetical protein